MALSVTPQATPITNRLIKEDALSNVPVINAAGAPTRVFAIDIDNTMNAIDAVYIKFYNTATVQPGVSQPFQIIPVEPNSRMQVSSFQGINYPVALSFLCSLDGGLPCGSPPVNPVTIHILCS